MLTKCELPGGVPSDRIRSISVRLIGSKVVVVTHIF